MSACNYLLRLFSLLSILFLWVGPCAADSFDEIDQHARNAPTHVTYDVKKLTSYLTKPATSNRQKVRSFYVWITENIAYDVRMFLHYDPNRYQKVLPNEVLKQRKAVCQGYAELFQVMCHLSDIPSRLIPGYSKGVNVEKNSFTRADHAWNAVKIDSQWYLLDVTWGSGGLNDQLKFVKKFNESYFLTDPQTFVRDHMPIDPVWQLLDCPVSMQSFVAGASAVQRDIANSAIRCEGQRAIAQGPAWLDSLKGDLASAQRAYRFNPANHQVLMYAYMNQAHHLMEDIPAQLRSRGAIEEALRVQKEALVYLQKAQELAKPLEKGEAQSVKKLLKAQLENARSNVNGLEKALQ